MGGRTPEELNNVREVISAFLPHSAQFPDTDTGDFGKPFQQALDSSFLSTELKQGLKDAVRKARWIGTMDGLKYGSGEGELPEDIKLALECVERMSQGPLNRELFLKSLRHPSTQILFGQHT